MVQSKHGAVAGQGRSVMVAVDLDVVYVHMTLIDPLLAAITVEMLTGINTIRTRAEGAHKTQALGIVNASLDILVVSVKV